MASKSQSEYIRDLAILKLKEYKEFEELLFSAGITQGDIALESGNMADAVHALTDLQASKLIDELTKKSVPARSTSYSVKRIAGVVGLLDDIKKDIESWEF